jgi:hypothetical protein
VRPSLMSDPRLIKPMISGEAADVGGWAIFCLCRPEGHLLVYCQSV